MIFLAEGKKLCHIKCDHVSGTFNQIPSIDEILPDLNHSSILNTKNKLMCENLHLTRTSYNEQSQQKRDKPDPGPRY